MMDEVRPTKEDQNTRFADFCNGTVPLDLAVNAGGAKAEEPATEARRITLESFIASFRNQCEEVQNGKNGVRLSKRRGVKMLVSCRGMDG